MAERSEPTAASFDSSRRSCACGDVDLGGLESDGWRVGEVHVGGLVHAASACLRPY